MTKLPLTIAALLIACLAAASAAFAGQPTTDRVASTLTVSYKGADPSDPYGSSTFKGKVTPRKCAKGRKVNIEKYGTEKTDSRGRFSLTLPSVPKPGKYTFNLAAKTFKRGGSEYTCKKATVVLTVPKG